MTLREFYLTLRAAMVWSSGFEDAVIGFLPDGLDDDSPDGLEVEINGQRFVLTAQEKPAAAPGRAS